MRIRTAALVLTGLALMSLGVGCSRDRPADAEASAGQVAESTARRLPSVTISNDQTVSPVPAWQAPALVIDVKDLAQTKTDAAAALETGDLFGDDDDAIPLYISLSAQAPDDSEVQKQFSLAVGALVEQGDDALDGIDEDPRSLRRAHEVAAVARVAAPRDQRVKSFLERVDRADGAREANLQGEKALNAGRIGEGDEVGALDLFDEASSLRPGDTRAQQGIAAAESALIRRAELAAAEDDYALAGRWLSQAEAVRPEMHTAEDALKRLSLQRAVRVGNLRDLGLAALGREGGIDEARGFLATLLRIALAGDPAAVELRERIELATHYGLFRPGQVFTDALANGGRGPEMVVVPHGAFRMGAAPGEDDATDAEYPSRNIRFDRGLAMSRNEITVGEYRRFVTATSFQPRASRRGYSTAYDERSGNLVRRGGVDWEDDYAGSSGAEGLPVVHVSGQDAVAYAEWLSEQTGFTYRLPSEAEFEYASRAGRATPFSWGHGTPPEGSGNFTGARDKSPSGRQWQNAFPGYGDGAWGPAKVGSYRANAFGLHDLAGNVSEWVADCWHDNYRRAPLDGKAWINPGCQSWVIRGGSWASSPAQTRSAWRLGSEVDTTNARVGFRVVREI